MRSLVVAAAAATALVVAASAASVTRPSPRVPAKVDEAFRLEVRALELYKQNAEDPEVESLIRRSMELLDDAVGMRGAPDSDLLSARGYDREFLSKRLTDRDRAARALYVAIVMKKFISDNLEDAAWKSARDEAKAAEKTPVSAPKCTRSLALVVPGCSKTDFWDINIDHDAKRARCTFRGPAGSLHPARPLFKDTIQETTCKLTNRSRVVGGVRKRVVHAELKITAPPGVTAMGSKIVQVTAHWQ